MSFRMAAMLALALSAIPAEFDGEIHKAVPVIAAEEETAAEEQTAEVPVAPTGTNYRVHGRTPNTEWQAALRNELRRYGIEWYMPYAVCQIWQESRWNQWSDNGHDRGITQQKGIYWDARAARYGVGGASIWDVQAQFRVFAGMMAGYLAATGNNIEWALSYYFYGSGAYAAKYVSDVLSHMPYLERWSE